tara:strand:+ start:449 stop:793 length:345 start_codon:yes stop_codon:yes gene_type:complete
MKSKTHGHYFANMEFIGRDIRVDVRYVKFDNTVDGKTGSGWVASVDDKPLSNMFDFTATASYSKRDCIELLKKLLARAYARKMRHQFKIHLGEISDDTLFDATYEETQVGRLHE